MDGNGTDKRNGAESILLSAVCLSVWVQYHRCHPCSGRCDINVMSVPVPDRSDYGLRRQAAGRFQAVIATRLVSGMIPEHYAR